MNNQTIHTRVAISGGGPAGIMLGYLLGRAGIDTVVVEKWPDFFRDFRGDTVHPSTMQVLDELDLADDFFKLPYNKMYKMSLHFGGTEATMANLSSLPAKYPFIAFVPQWDFLNMMSEKAKEFPAFHLKMETEVLDLIKDGDKIVGMKVKNADGTESDIMAELVIGADGRHSVVREKGGFEMKSLGVPIDVLWFRVNKIDQNENESLGYLDCGQALIMLDRDDYWQCGLIIEKGRFEEIKSKGLEHFKKNIASLGHLKEDATSVIDSWDKVKLLSVSVDRALKWAKEGVLIIGDAAHAMSPLGGVGVNYAVQDAVATANILIPALKQGGVNLEVLNKVQARREKPAQKTQAMQMYLHNHMLSPLLHEKGKLKVPFFVRLFNLLPFLSRIPAKIIGLGFKPEHIAKNLFD